MSDGTSVLQILDTGTLKVDSTLEVSDRDATVRKINELEFVEDRLYANIYQTDRIVIIDPQNVVGLRVGWI
jgi:glutamine cyclotransferase